jgi:hypothetical protein
MPVWRPARHKQSFQAAFKRERQMDWSLILTAAGDEGAIGVLIQVGKI